MKQIKNTAKLGFLTMGLNVLIAVLFIITMFFLSKFDKINVDFVKEKATFERASERMHEAENPAKKANAEVDFYKNKLDSLRAMNVPSDKKLAKTLNEDIERTKGTIAEKSRIKAGIDLTITAEHTIFEPLSKSYNDILVKNDAAKGTYHLLLYITICLLVIKIAVFALYNYQNHKNLLSLTNWMKKGSAPYWAFVGWIIPIYDFIKPYSYFSEIWNDTDYLLKDKGIIPNDGKEDNSDFNIGIWWALLLICFLIVTWILHSTIMGTGPMFVKFSHTGVIVTATILWIIYLCQECNIIRLFNKKNKQLEKLA